MSRGLRELYTLYNNMGTMPAGQGGLRGAGQRVPHPPWARAVPTGTSGQGCPGSAAVLGWDAQAGAPPVLLCAPRPALAGAAGSVPRAPRCRCVLAQLRAAVTAQWLRDSTLASCTFSRASEGASRAGRGQSGAQRWAQSVPGGHLGWPCQPWLSTKELGRCRGGPRALGEWGTAVWARHSPRHLAQHGLSLVAGLAQADGGHSWRWQCVSPDWGAQRGAEHRGWGAAAPQGAVGVRGAALPPIPKALGTGTVAPSLALELPRAGALTTHQHRIHFISPKGGTDGCQLSLLRYQRRPKRQPRGSSACMESASSGTLLSGAAGKGAARMPACGTARGGTREPCREDGGQERGAGTWALLAAVGGVGTHGVGTGEPRALHLLTVHFTCGALQGGTGRSAPRALV